ncbi:hypothetical protein CcCBS67573_g06931 [Chytriomyces confervae]|uniref:Uncharacterized protein n=1 Tax=Chytriomyces confervae TaxID=246404 RepID=A0A507EYZ5_9FUNG|nr:hypothetical protein HDU80_009608 [Chytriomyces hyalinus]TPX69181.1 hypothetical protein CcCBS67573_g06931 [Chytriomyces confervae]
MADAENHEEEKPKGRVCCGIEWTKRRIIAFVTSAVILLLAVILLVVFVIGPKIAQSSIDGSTLTLTASAITNATNTSFALKSTGQVTNAGGLPATLNFPNAVTVYWTAREKGEADLPLGTVNLSPITVSGGNGAITLDTVFNVVNADNMATFSTYMIKSKSFSWRMSGVASATAMGLTFNNLNMDKVVTLSGFNGLSQVTVKSFEATAGTGNDVNVNVVTQLVNPSSITMEMGDSFFLFNMGTGAGTMSAKSVTIVPGNNTLTMVGVLSPPASAANATAVKSLNANFASLFANAVDNVVPVSVTGDRTSRPATWLNRAFKSMTLSVSMNLTSIAQDSVSGAELSLDSSSITNVTETSFRLAGAGAAKNAGFMDATLSFPTPVKVSWSNNGVDVPLGTLNLQPVSVSGPTPKSGKVAVDSIFSLTNVDGMARFASFMINSDKFTWKLEGSASAEAYGLGFTNLKLSKTISLGGFNGLKGVTIDRFDLPSSNAELGIAISTDSTIVNPSTISMNMGDVTFDVQTNTGMTIGNLKAADMSIVPGANKYTLNGGMKVADQPALSKLMNDFLNGNGLDSVIVGSTGSTSWLTKALKDMKLTVKVPSPVLTEPIVSGITIPAMAVEMLTSDPTGYSVSVNSPVITAKFKVPYTFPIEVQQVSQSLNFVDEATNTPFAQFVTEMMPASADQSTNILTTSVTGGSLKAIAGQEAVFAKFMYGLTFVDKASVGITGSATSVAKTDAGIATISLPLADHLALTGFQGFQNIQILKTSVVGGTAEGGVQMKVSLILNNPSTLSLATNVDVKMDLVFDPATVGIQGVPPTKVGYAIMPNMKVVPGPNPVLSDCFVMADASNPVSVAVVRALMSGFIAGKTAPMAIKGNLNSIIYDSLKPAFAGLSIPASITGPEAGKKLVLGSRIYPRVTGDKTDLYTDFHIVNPLDTPFYLRRIQAEVVSELTKSVIGTIDFTMDPPFMVPANSDATTPQTLLIQTAAQNVLAPIMVSLLQGGGVQIVHAKQVLTAAIGTYWSMIDYESVGIEVTLGPK